jgi:hypothetical protein
MSDQTRTVISKSATRRTVKQNGVTRKAFTEQVVIKTPIGKKAGKMKYSSQTVHLVCKD